MTASTRVGLVVVFWRGSVRSALEGNAQVLPEPVSHLLVLPNKLHNLFRCEFHLVHASDDMVVVVDTMRVAMVHMVMMGFRAALRIAAHAAAVTASN